MKRLGLTILCTLTALGCTRDPIEEVGSESGTDDGATTIEAESGLEESGSTGPTTCAYGDTVYDPGDVFDTPDGCITYRCNGPDLAIVSDRLITVPGDLDLSSQELVNEQICLEEVAGTLTISGTAADLTPLGNLGRVGGNLTITASAAVTLAGLGTIFEVGDTLTISDNAQLTTLAFQTYMGVYGDVIIQNNDALASLQGAEFIGQCATCIGAGPDPQQGGGDEPGSDSGAPPEPPSGSAEGGDGGEDTGEPGGTFYGKILIADNDVLTDITALGGLVYAWDDVRFRNNAILPSLAAMRLIETQGDLEITNHASLDTTEANAFASGVTVWGATLVCGNLGGPVCP